jgi:hypothetical protein
LIELFDRVFNFFLFFICHQVAFVEQNNIGELDLIAHQLEDGSIIGCVHIGEDFGGNVSTIEIMIEVAAINNCDASIKLTQLSQFGCRLRKAWIKQWKIESECLCYLHWLRDSRGFND